LLHHSQNIHQSPAPTGFDHNGNEPASTYQCLHLCFETNRNPAKPLNPAAPIADLQVLEYSELDPAKASSTDPATGQLYFNWSNICMHYFSIDWLATTVEVRASRTRVRTRGRARGTEARRGVAGRPGVVSLLACLHGL
jgi:hypothetical protein